MAESKLTARQPAPAVQGSLAEVAGLFLKLGTIAFGGPAAHIAMMREEVVERRRWLTEQRFLDLLGITNLIPGPNSTEMAIHLGYLRAGWPGLITAGACFIAPAAVIVLALAWAYARYGAMPEATWLLYGVKPVILAIIAQALWRLGAKALNHALGFLLGLAVLVLYLFGGNEIALLFGGGVIFAVTRWAGKQKGERLALGLPLLSTVEARQLAALPAGAAAAAAAPFSLATLFLTFLKIGAVLYGSGYVLLAFLRNDFVHRLGWLTDQQLLDAISIGQFTPGPVFTTATFIGYVVAGWQGAALATLGIFLPSFVFVALVRPLADALRRSAWTSALLDGVNVAAVALMAGVLLRLGASTLIDPLTWIAALLSFGVLVRFKVNSAWLILAGAAVGLARLVVSG